MDVIILVNSVKTKSTAWEKWNFPNCSAINLQFLTVNGSRTNLKAVERFVLAMEICIGNRLNFVFIYFVFKSAFDRGNIKDGKPDGYGMLKQGKFLGKIMKRLQFKKVLLIKT